MKLSYIQIQALKALSKPNWFMWTVSSITGKVYSIQEGIPQHGGKTVSIKGQTFKYLVENKFVENVSITGVKATIYKITESGLKSIS